jgi:hypothetical protein
VTDLSQETSDYQLLLEHHRLDPDDEHTWELLCRAREAMEVAWLAHVGRLVPRNP